jgi:hypothetical protein
VLAQAAKRQKGLSDELKPLNVLKQQLPSMGVI